MIRQLIDTAGSTKVIMVEISRTEATVTVVAGTQVQAWGYRAGVIKQVATDIQYVDQAIFDINNFNLTDVGALFRAAASVSGSDAQQSLQIVDYSAGEVLMAVSTNPESRTVFFRPDGSVVDTLDFHTESGVKEGLNDAVGQKRQAIRVGINSDSGAYIDYVGPNDTTMRRLRLSRIPASTTQRSDTPNLPEFDPHTVSPATVWSTLERLTKDTEFSSSTPWSLTVYQAEDDKQPLMHFTIDGKEHITDLNGDAVH